MIRRSPFAMAAIAIWTLGACTTAVQTRPEPEIRTVEVKVPVVQPCPALEVLGPSPAYPDSDQALAAASNLYERVKLLLAGRVLRMQREATINATVAACR